MFYICKRKECVYGDDVRRFIYLPSWPDCEGCSYAIPVDCEDGTNIKQCLMEDGQLCLAVI